MCFFVLYIVLLVILTIQNVKLITEFGKWWTFLLALIPPCFWIAGMTSLWLCIPPLYQMLNCNVDLTTIIASRIGIIINAVAMVLTAGLYLFLILKFKKPIDKLFNKKKQ